MTLTILLLWPAWPGELGEARQPSAASIDFRVWPSPARLREWVLWQHSVLVAFGFLPGAPGERCARGVLGVQLVEQPRPLDTCTAASVLLLYHPTCIKHKASPGHILSLGPGPSPWPLSSAAISAFLPGLKLLHASL